MRKVEVVPHSPQWKETFTGESELISRVLGREVVAIHHIGSTRIRDIPAKPVIDILLEVRDVAALDEHNAAMESLGYEAKGEFGLAGRRYFRKDDAEGNRTHHVNAFTAGSDEAIRHLAFRDYLIAHPDEARIYGELKANLARLHPADPEAYMDGKDDFIKQIEQKATRWRSS